MPTSTPQDEIDLISEALVKVESWESGLGRLVRRTTNEWSEQLESLVQSVAAEVEQLKKLRAHIEKENEIYDDSRSGTLSTNSIEPYYQHRLGADLPRCTGELKVARWGAIPTTIEPAHPTLYILRGPIPTVLRDPRDVLNSDLATEVSNELPPAGLELPECIVMKSMRLLTYIDFNIYNGSLDWHEDEDQNVKYIIQRPFKILVFFDKEIRNALSYLEGFRSIKAGSDSTEDEYDADWERHPPPDAHIPGCPFDIGCQTVPELTALIKDLRVLTKFMDRFLHGFPRDVPSNIYFSELWLMFPPRSFIYVKNKSIPQKIWRVIQRTSGRPEPGRQLRESRLASRDSGGPVTAQFLLDCYHLDFDGSRYIPIFHRFIIEPFDGKELVAGLPVVPLQVAESLGNIDPEAIINRGRDFIECTRPTHRDYTGRNQLQKPNGEDMVGSDTILPDTVSRYSEWIDSEVMVDMERALHAVPAWRPTTSEFKAFKGDSELLERLDRFRSFDFDDDQIWDRKATDQFMSEETEKWLKMDQDHPPTEREDLLLLPDRVFAFVFRTRKWACLKLGKSSGGEEMLRKRENRDDPWNDLELPDGHKNLVQSLIESHMEGNASRKLHFDLVRAKGKGVIILLHGVPGVGKTSTAECAAEANNRPLLPITCGDLGTSPKEVETKLQEAFQLAQLWNCVLLLDEADVFLAQRSEDDIQRNALVSVFLRVLEYYEGILFLTSNRVGVFDEALKSRLHMALYYPPLEWKYTKRIWDTHLTKLTNSGLIDLNHKDILDYAETFFADQERPDLTIGLVWNGRQIRNAFQSAVALAGYKHQSDQKIVLTRDHFEKVSKVSNQFNNYLWSIQCKTDSDKASTWGVRHDGWVKPGSGNFKKGASSSKKARNGSIDIGAINLGLHAAAAGPGYHAPQQQPQQQIVPQMVPGPTIPGFQQPLTQVTHQAPMTQATGFHPGFPQQGQQQYPIYQQPQQPQPQQQQFNMQYQPVPQYGMTPNIPQVTHQSHPPTQQDTGSGTSITFSQATPQQYQQTTEQAASGNQNQ